MKISVPKERYADETRVALIPESVARLVRTGVKVQVEQDAGIRASFSNEEYEKAGAEIIDSPERLFTDSDMMAKIRPPAENDALGRHEIDALREGSSLITFLQPLNNPDLIRRLQQHNITSFSMEFIPRISRAQSMDALSSMSTVAGYKAVLLAASALHKFLPMLMTAAGTIAPSRVLIIGAGVAGLQAIATARRLGANVEAYDTRPVVKEQVESLGAKFIELKLETADTEDAGGYAKAQSEEFYAKQQELMQDHAQKADVVITTALIPGKKAPILIPEETVKQMRPGSVIMDLAAEMGGNCALTERGKDVVQHGVTIMGPVNLPAMMPYHASQMYSRNMTAVLLHLIQEQELQLDFEDEITRSTCATHQGQMINETIKQVVEQTG